MSISDSAEGKSSPSNTAPTATHGAGSPQSMRSASSSWKRWGLVVLLLLPAQELVWRSVQESRVLSDDDVSQAMQELRSILRPEDRVEVRPRWLEPRVREFLGDALSLKQAGDPGFANSNFDRAGVVYAVLTRGHRLETEAPRVWTKNFGRIRLERIELPHRAMLYDFVAQIDSARVFRKDGEQLHPCSHVDQPAPSPPLFGGPVTPNQRFVCDPGGKPWLWTGATVMTDLNYYARRCVFQHPQGVEPIRTDFANVPLGEKLAVGAGIVWMQERTLDHAPVEFTAFIDGRPIGQLVHRDGEGWKSYQMNIPRELQNGTHNVSFEVTTPSPGNRTFCWAAESLGSLQAR